MNDFIAAAAPIGVVADAAPAFEPTATAATGNFAGWFDHQVAQLDSQLSSAEKGVQQLAAGDAASLHDVMIRMEEAKLAFHLAVQVRSRLLDAYQEVMRMQV